MGVYIVRIFETIWACYTALYFKWQINTSHTEHYAVMTWAHFSSRTGSFIMMTSSNDNILRVVGLYAGNSPVTGEIPSQRPVTRTFDVFLDLRLNKRPSKQSRRRWFAMSSRSLWRHCNEERNSSITAGFPSRTASNAELWCISCCFLNKASELRSNHTFYNVTIHRWLSTKLWYSQHNCVGYTIVNSPLKDRDTLCSVLVDGGCSWVRNTRIQ